MSDKMQHSRFELKYMVDESTALRARDFIRSYLEIDEFGANKPTLAYPTISLYLDSDELTTYWDTINGNKNRFKLRLRYYDEKPNTPVFFEVKRRMNNIIMKERAGIRKPAVQKLLAGYLPEPADLFKPNDADQWHAIHEFNRLMLSINARARMHIAYMREAWENPFDNSVRVTMDREVESAPNPSGELRERSRGAHQVFGKTVILELKYTNRFPGWFNDLVRTFNCVQGGAAKYAEGIFVRGENWANNKTTKTPQETIQEFLQLGDKVFTSSG